MMSLKMEWGGDIHSECSLQIHITSKVGMKAKCRKIVRNECILLYTNFVLNITYLIISLHNF